MKKIAFVIAWRNFRDEEYFVPKKVFEEAGFEVKTVSPKKGLAIGGSGGEAEVDLTFDELEIADFDALVFAGGPGAYQYIDDPIAQEFARRAIEQGKVLAAICIAPAILARAGVLQGKKATVWSCAMDKKPIQLLKENGAEYIDKPVVCDGNIITANGPAAAEQFGKAVAQALEREVEREV